MSQNTTKAKKTTKKHRKPIRRAENFSGAVLPAAGKLVPQIILIAILGLMLTGIQAISAYWLRIALSAVAEAALLLMIYSEGLHRGVSDVGASRTYAQAKQDGRTLTRQDDAACYHPLKALLAALAVFGLPLVLSVYLALNAKEYTYQLQSLPAWLSGTYGMRSDVMDPLAAYGNTAGMMLIDWVRLFVRLFELVLINLFEDPQKMTAMIDRFSPLMISVLPAAYMVGYLLAPRRAEKIEKENRRAKKVAVRRAERRKVGPELLGAQNQVHYGHKKEEKARKKKELI